MSAGNEILWSPVHEDKFVTWSPELSLYEIGPISDPDLVGSQTHFHTSDTTEVVLLATHSTLRYVKSLDIRPRADSDLLLAVGQANGRVALASFGPATDPSGREFAPSAARQCNGVLWNKTDPNILAAAFEKSKTDYAILAWDAFRTSAERPVLEYGLGEAANSIAWLNVNSIVAGLGGKVIRLIDRRDPKTVGLHTFTKSVHGICLECHSPDLLASYIDQQICVWDLRNFEKPITTAIRQKSVTKILWCPTRRNLLASMQKDSAELVLHDLQLTTISNDEVEPTLLERPIVPWMQQKMSSFSWHPTIESRLLIIYPVPYTIKDYVVQERITLNWFPSSNLVWTHGHRQMKVISERDSIYASLLDVSSLIKRRALVDYGLKTELWQNGELAENESLKTLWYWLYTSKSLVEGGVIKSTIDHPGVLSVLQSDKRSEPMMMAWADVPTAPSLRTFRSEDRDAALQLCGWRYDKDSLSTFLEQLLAKEEFSRAAAIAVFNLKINLAINILSRGATRKQQPELGIVAMALSGFSGDTWRKHCAQASAKLTDPYVRATFAFLTAEPEKYDVVLNEVKIAVEDRVAFALIFLSDSKLNDFLTKLIDNLTLKGDLAGVLLTGTNLDAVKLLQRYLDLTGDVQSVSLLAIRSFPSALLQDPAVQLWIESYQLLLDSTKLWNQRAHFDITMNECSGTKKVSHQIFISCNFCQKSISSILQGRNRSVTQKLPMLKMKMSCCPHCRKPLPRCAVCLVHIGTPSRLSGQKTADLASWFTWCQSCRHGGHTDHLQLWFGSHSECPVTGCSCRCLTLDSTVP